MQGAALSFWYSIPGHLPAPVRQYDEQCERLSRRGLGATARDRAFEMGRRLDRAAAIASALETKDKPAGRAVAAPAVERLSKRELEVAELVAAGLTDRDIATRLVISLRTSESHVQHILTKLGFRSRTQIASWVATRSEMV